MLMKHLLSYYTDQRKEGRLMCVECKFQEIKLNAFSFAF